MQKECNTCEFNNQKLKRCNKYDPYSYRKHLYPDGCQDWSNQGKKSLAGKKTEEKKHV
jgi:hypothetical protein